MPLYKVSHNDNTFAVDIEGKEICIMIGSFMKTFDASEYYVPNELRLTRHMTLHEFLIDAAQASKDYGDEPL